MQDNNIFNQEFYSNVNRNWYDLSHVHKTTARFGKLYPVLVQEVIPGDYFDMSAIKQGKALTLKTPVFHRMRIFEHWYFVPNRLVWDNWEKFITDTESGIPPPTIQYPDAAFLPIDTTVWQTIGQYMGLPLDLSVNQWLVNVMPLAAYALIWNEYYREQSVMGEITINIQDGINATPTNISINYMNACLMKCWRKDYFTSVLPSAQKGSPVKMPLNNTPTVPVIKAGSTNPQFVTLGNVPMLGAVTGGGAGVLNVGGAPSFIQPNGSLVVNLDTNAVTMNTFRFAMALQSFLEKDNIGGGRYTEVIRAHFNEMPPDFRLQRPEYLGGNVQTMLVDEILSTAETLDASSKAIPIGQYGGNMNSMYAGDRVTYKSTEHGFIICLVSAEPDLDYITKGINKKWNRELREDYAWPTFAHLGEQPIYNWEINADHNDPSSIFGYQPPYTDYKFAQNMISGDFANTLAYWHMGIEAPVDVAFNSNFLLIDDVRWDLTRIFAIDPSGPDGQVEDYLLWQIYFDIKVQRALPRFSIPHLVG